MIRANIGIIIFNAMSNLTPMTLAEIKDFCDQQAVAELSAALLNTPKSQQFFALLGTPVISLEDPKAVFSADRKSLSISAKTSWRGLTGLPVTLVCYLDERGLMQFAFSASAEQIAIGNLLQWWAVSVNAELPPFHFPAVGIEIDTKKNLAVLKSTGTVGESWLLFGIPTLSLSNLSFVVSYQHFGVRQGATLTLEIGGDMRAGPNVIRARVLLPLLGNFPKKTYVLTLKGLTPINHALDGLGAFLCGVPPGTLLPPSFSNVPEVYLTELTAELDAAQKKISRAFIQLDVKKPWLLTEGLAELQQASLKLTIDPPAGNFLQIKAVIQTGPVQASITIDAGAPDSDWEINLTSAIKLPALKQITGLSTALAMDTWQLPESLISEPVAVRVQELRFVFNPAQKLISGFRFAAEVKQVWALLPGLQVGNGAIWIEKETGSGFTGGVSGQILINETVTIYLGGERTADGFELEGDLETEQPVMLPDLMQKLLPGFEMPESFSAFGIRGGSLKIRTADKELEVRADGLYREKEFRIGLFLGANKTLKVSIENITLEMAAGLLGLPYPGDLPNPKVTLFKFSINKDGEIEAGLNVTDCSPADSHVQVSAIDFEYQRTKSGKEQAVKAKLAFRASAHIPGILDIDQFNLGFTCAQSGTAKTADWELRQSLEGKLMGSQVKLTAAYSGEKGRKSIGLKLEGELPAIGLPGLFSLKLLSGELRVTKADKETPAGIRLVASASLSTPLFTFDQLGTVFYHEGEKTGIALTAGSADIRLLGEGMPWFTLCAPSLKVSYDSAEKAWGCEGDALFMARDIPETLRHILPAEKVSAGFVISRQKAELRISTADLIRIPLPPQVPGLDMSAIADIGDLYLGVSAFRADIRNKKITASVAIGLPKNLNHVFKTGKSTFLDLFRVYDPDGARETVQFSLSAGEDGLGFQLESSPFRKFGTVTKPAGRPVLDLDMGDYGRIELLLPEFSLKTDGSLKASGGFHIKKDLAIPLLPLTFLLQQLGLQDIAKVLPSGIPLKGISFVDKIKTDRGEHLEFRLEKFFGLFSDPQAMPLPASVKETFKTVNQYLSRLPDSFLEYADIEIPKDLFFHLEFTPAGSFKGELSVKDPARPDADTKPLKLILPQFPVFVGIQLKSLSAGELFAGSLFRVDVDAVIDIFDVPTLGASLLIDPELPVVQALLPDIKSLRRQVTLKNLTTLVIYQTGIPVPIPLFYDKLGFSALGLDGTEIVSSFEFPMPSVGLGTLKDFALISSQLVGFFRDGRPFDREKLKTIQFIHFTVGPNFIRLPKYVAKEKPVTGQAIKGQLIGSEEGFTIDPLAIFLAVTDSISKGSVNALIRSIELRRRVGTVDICLFDALELKTQYAFTTPYEFQEEAYQRLGIKPDESSAYLRLLPAPRDYNEEPGTIRKPRILLPETEGLIIFMSSSLNLQKLLDFKIGFALMAMEEGIGMGGRFAGRIAAAEPAAPALLDIDLQGLIRVGPENGAQLEGAGHLTLLGQNIVQGDFYFDKNRLRLDGKLGEKGMPFYARGNLEGHFTKTKFLLEGSTEIAILGFASKGRLLLDIREDAQRFLLEGKADIGPLAHVSTGIAYAKDAAAAFIAIYFDGYLGPLDLQLNGRLAAGPRGIAAHGELMFTFAGEPVLRCECSYTEQQFTFDGSLDLFPKVPKELLEAAGQVSGRFSPETYRMEGGIRLRIAGFTMLNATFLLDTEQALLSAGFSGLQLNLWMERGDGVLRGSMQAIYLGTALVIRSAGPASSPAARSLGGPELALSTAPAVLTLSGKAQLLGMETTLEGLSVREGAFELVTSGHAFGLVKTDLRLSWISLRAGASAAIHGAVHLEEIAEELSAYITEAARQIRDSLERAFMDLATARENVKKAAEAVAENIHEKVAGFKKQLEGQERFLTERQAEVNRLSGLISACYNEIASLKEEIEGKKRWYNDSGILQKAYRWIELAAVVAEKGLAITRNYALAGLLEGLQYTAIGLLEAAKEVTRGIEKLIGEAEKAADAGLELLQQAADQALKNAQSALVIISNTVGMFEDWSKRVLAAGKAVVEIESATFDAYLSKAAGGEVLLEIKLKMLGEFREIQVGYTLFSREHNLAAITHTLKAGTPRADELAITAKSNAVDVLSAAKQIMEVYVDLTPAQLSVALLRGGYERRSEVQKIALYELFVKPEKVDVSEIAAAIMIGQRYLESYEKMK
ncbi:hypothetical protein [Mucilaginibacter sp.]|uniref:hypothetical protein n=1 Tax=Mucilaginibacter sp. TaxID=1882438 RepID=UPI0032639069